MKRSILATLQAAVVFITAAFVFSSGNMAFAATPIATQTFSEAPSTNVTASNTARLLESLYAQLQALEAQITALKAISPIAATTSVMAATTSPTICTPLTLTHSLAIGSTRSDVSSLQTFLESQGYYTYPSITGYFGPVTKTAVIAFQTANGIDPVGIVGPITRAKISDLSAACPNATSVAQGGPTLRVPTSTGAIATTISAKSAPTVPIPQPIATGNTPGFGGGGTPAPAPVSNSPPGWVLSGAVEDLDFAGQQYYGGNAGSLLSVSRASPESCMWPDGHITYASNNTPCITDLGLAVWQRATNELEYSGDPSQLLSAAWFTYANGSGSVSVTGAASTSPDLTNSAALVTVNRSGSTGYGPNALLGDRFGSSAGTYTASIWLKANSAGDAGKSINLALTDGISFDAITVTLNSTWTRYAMTETLASNTENGTGGGPSFSVGYSGSSALSQNGQVQFLAWGAQVESGAIATPYVPTTAATSSRAADDIAAIGSLSTTLGASTATLSVVTNKVQAAATSTLVDSNGSILLGQTATNTLATNLTSTVTTGNTAIWTGVATSSLAWSVTGRTLALNSGLVVTSSTAITPAATFHLGSTGGTSSFINGYITRLTAWTSRLPDASIGTVPDITPPTVSLTVPSNAATISGSAVALIAVASDNVAVANVQFDVDGANIGSAATTSPYTVTWNSQTVLDGTHIIAAVAEDTSGNYATSSISVTTSNGIVAGTTFYVSPTGNDANNGTSTSTPWQTVAKVNASTFYAGDSVLFQGGQTFNGCLAFTGTNVLSSTSSPFTVGSYGSGDFTLHASCSGSQSSAVNMSGVSGIVLQDCILTGNNGGAQYGVWIHNPNDTSSPSSGITVQRCDISGFYTTNTSDYGAEIFVTGYPGNPAGALDHVSLLDNTLHGASTTSPDDDGITGYGYGKNISNILYQGNTVYDIGGKANGLGGSEGDGILADGVNGGLIQDNLVHDTGANANTCGGPVGIMAYSSNNITMQYNEVYNVTPTTYTAGCDWDGFDLDGSVTNSVMQYNYSHNNWGGGYLLYGSGTWGPNTVRYNISENDDQMGSGGFAGLTFSINSSSDMAYVYNNTILNSRP